MLDKIVPFLAVPSDLKNLVVPEILKRAAQLVSECLEALLGLGLQKDGTLSGCAVEGHHSFVRSMEALPSLKLSVVTGALVR